jgi:hypothetical protein
MVRIASFKRSFTDIHPYFSYMPAGRKSWKIQAGRCKDMNGHGSDE